MLRFFFFFASFSPAFIIHIAHTFTMNISTRRKNKIESAFPEVPLGAKVNREQYTTLLIRCQRTLPHVFRILEDSVRDVNAIAKISAPKHCPCLHGLHLHRI